MTVCSSARQRRVRSPIARGVPVATWWRSRAAERHRVPGVQTTGATARPRRPWAEPYRTSEVEEARVLHDERAAHRVVRRALQVVAAVVEDHEQAGARAVQQGQAGVGRILAGRAVVGLN